MVRVSETQDVTLDVVMASACLPFLFKAVTIDGEDGGHAGNPALFPLLCNTDSRDLLIVHINPMVQTETPTTAPDIMSSAHP